MATITITFTEEQEERLLAAWAKQFDLKSASLDDITQHLLREIGAVVSLQERETEIRKITIEPIGTPEISISRGR